MGSLDELRDHPCYPAAVGALAELVLHAHGCPIDARACDDGSIALEIREGDGWRVLLSLEPDPADSGWAWVYVGQTAPVPRLTTGNLSDIDRLGPWIQACLAGH